MHRRAERPQISVVSIWTHSLGRLWNPWEAEPCCGRGVGGRGRGQHLQFTTCFRCRCELSGPCSCCHAGWAAGCHASTPPRPRLHTSTTLPSVSHFWSRGFITAPGRKTPQMGKTSLNHSVRLLPADLGTPKAQRWTTPTAQSSTILFTAPAIQSAKSKVSLNGEGTEKGHVTSVVSSVSLASPLGTGG